MIVTTLTVILNFRKRGPEFLSAVMQHGKLDDQKKFIEIDERDWLIACDRWPADPVRLASNAMETKPCC